MTLYKILSGNRSSHGGSLAWDLPKGDTPGQWHEVALPLRPCKHGLHLATEPGAWLQWGADLYEAEASGEVLICDSHKVCAQKARLLRKLPDPPYWATAKAFVASIPSTRWFQQHGAVQPHWQLFPTRHAAWEAARDVARHAARVAARDAAWVAARDAARDAAWDAAWVAAWEAARDAARDAAHGAARHAARHAAWEAARDAITLSTCIIAWNDPSNSHTAHALSCWQVWTEGYGLAATAGNTFYVYRSPL